MKKKPNEIPFGEVAATWLHSNGIAVSDEFVTRELESHSLFPSLISLTDLLDMGGMSYTAIRSSEQYIREFNYPLLAHIKDEHADFMMQVNSAAEWDQNELLKNNWSGIVLFADGKPRWEVKENSTTVKRKRSLIVTGVIALLILLSATGFLFRGQLEVLHIVWGVLSLAGIAISMMTIAKELGMQIKVVNEMCNSVSAFGCDAVLRSKYAKGIGGISIADASLAYFGAQFVFYLLSRWIPSLLPATQLMAIPLIVVAGVSIYTQKYRVKRWCVLCLGIVAVLVLQGAAGIVRLQEIYPAFVPAAVVYFLILQAAICLMLLPLKGTVKDIREKMKQAGELRKWKKDPVLFVHQWQQRPITDTAMWPKELQFGNPDAPLQLTVACNPYCGPCAQAHTVLDELYEQYKELLNIRIRFLCDPEKEIPATIAVRAMLQCAATLQQDHEIAHMLSDWFKHMNLEKWQQQWHADTNIPVQDQLIQHSTWMKTAGIRGTPTFFLNGRELPGRYMLQDLQYLIPVLPSAMMAADTSMPLTV